MAPSDLPPQPPDGVGTCSCTCLCCGPCSPSFDSRRRALKRKLEELEEQQLRLSIISSSRSSNFSSDDDDVSARVEIENEAAALRETLGSHQKSIQELYEELEQERSASATAASEAMSMILRLQREKAESQMEFRQFKRLAEEKMAHDQEEIATLEDLLFKRDQALQSLSCEIQAYKHRLMSFGYGPTLSEPPTPNTATAAGAAASAFDYPPLRCNIPGDLDVEDAADLDKYAFGETPRDQIQNLEHRIYQMERMPSISHEKGVVAYSPRKPIHSRRFSVDSYGSSSFAEFPVAVERGWERDDVVDRVYTVEAVHCEPASYMSTPRDFGRNNEKKVASEEDGIVKEAEIKRLYMRLQVLEADRETMRQTMLSMGTDKAQLVLLKEIAQQLCKESKPSSPPQQKIVRKPSFVKSLSVLAVMKWITSFVFWRRKSSRTRYSCGVTNSNLGLLLLLDKSPRMRMRRCLTRALR